MGLPIANKRNEGMNDQELRFIAIKLEHLVTQDPYRYVPGNGYGGAFGINYFNIVRSVLELANKKEQ